MGIMLGLLHGAFDSKDLGYFRARWIISHRENTHLFHCDIKDDRWNEIIAHELDFIFSHCTKVFSAKADSRTAHHLAATTSNWWHSSLIVRDTPPPVLPKMVRETQDYLTAPYAAAIRPLASGVGKCIGRLGPYKFGSTQSSSALRLSCAVAAISALVQWITGINVLPQINECFPLANDIGRSFAILSSVEIAYELILKNKKGDYFRALRTLNILGISPADDLLGLFPIHAIQATNNAHNHAFPFTQQF